MVLTLLFLCFWLMAGASQGFVLLSGPEEARLPSTRDLPEITFYISSQSPSLKKKESFQGGRYADKSDQELWPILVQEAMDRWNQVPGSFIQLRASMEGGEPVADPEDSVFAIVVGSEGVTTAASASPQSKDGIIYDCDINVSSREVSAKSLAYTLMHEIGHCLGLGHNHSNYDAVMGYSRSDRSLRLGADDIAGLTYLYPTGDDFKSAEDLGCGSVRGRAESGPWEVPIFLLLAPFLLVILKDRIKDGQRLRRKH